MVAIGLVALATAVGVAVTSTPAAAAATAPGAGPLVEAPPGPRVGAVRFGRAAMAAVRSAASVLRQVTEPAPAGVYERPIDAPIIDGFRPPSTPYGSGNRGWEYAPDPGQIVRAAADGVVTFAGPVGGTVAVTVAHADGLRTSYSLLASALVTEGATVRRGDPVGRSGPRFHFGVRRGDTYLDPALLFAEPVARHPRLVPLGR